MQCTFISLEDIMISTFFIQKPLSQNKFFKFCLYFVFSELYLDDMQLLVWLYRLFISFRFTLIYAVSGLPASFFPYQQVSLGRFELFPCHSFRYYCQFWVQVSECAKPGLQPLPNTFYTNYYSLKHCSLQSVWTQKQNKSGCILGAFIDSVIWQT